MRSYDVIVLGLGGIGSAIADALAMKGHSILGLERFSPVHDKGSSHGESRVIRKAYFEDRRYVPLLLRAYELWDELATGLDTGAPTQLLNQTGCLVIGPTGGKSSRRRLPFIGKGFRFASRSFDRERTGRTLWSECRSEYGKLS